MKKTRKKTSLIVTTVLVVVLLGTAACSKNRNQSAAKERRKDVPVTTLSKPTLPSMPTTSNPLENNSQPLLSANEIKQTWQQEKLCALLNGEQAQTILKSTTKLTPKYTFSELTGARCTYSDSSGDQIYFELSTKSYLKARAIDAAMKVSNTEVVVGNTKGVSQNNGSTGVIYHLKIWGQSSNQWSVSGPDEQRTKEATSIVVSSLE